MLGKIVTIAGLIVHIFYFVLAILSLNYYEYSGTGIGKAFSYWIYAMIIAIICMAIYAVDVICKIVKKRSIYNKVNLGLVAVGIPLLLFIGTTTGTVNSITWNTYFILLFVFEFVSLFLKGSSIARNNKITR